MKIKWNGKFNGDPESLPNRPHRPGAVKFKEIDDVKKLALFMNLASIPLVLLTIALTFLRGGTDVLGFGMSIGCILALLMLIPHEFLHAICFREKAYIYTYLEKGMLFVYGPEDLSKGRFIFLSLLPNLVFGFIPYLIFMLFPLPELNWLGMLGALSIPCGIGDYYNVFHALTQMPKGAKTYMYGFNSWWYLPQ